MRVRRIAIATLLAVAVVGPALAVALPASAATSRLAVVDEAVDEPGVGVTVCNGSNQEAALVRTNDVPTNLVENGAFAQLPGAVIQFNTPANDSDQIIVIFSAEAILQGQPVTYTAPVDFLQIQILLDGVPMLPLNDLAFTTGAGESDATQTCHRLPANDMAMVHTVRVVWMLVDQSGAMLTGTLDDWTLHVEINN